MRFLTISKPYVARAYRQKFVELAKFSDLEIGLITPSSWGKQNFESDLQPTNYWQRQVPILLNGHNHFHCYRGLDAAIDEFKPDLINIEEEHYSLVTWQVRKLAQKRRIPIIFFTWQNIFKNYPPPFCWTESNVLNNAVGAIAGNQEAAMVLRRKGFRLPVAVIPQMGVDCELFAGPPISSEHRAQEKKRLGLDPDKIAIAYIGRMVEEKGVEVLIDAVSAMPNRSTVEVVLIGSGDQLNGWIQRAQNRQVNIRHIAQVPSDSIAEYLRLTEILCLPSETRANWKEQFGRVLIEAMAAGSTVVGSDSGEIPIVVANAGKIFPEKDVAALSSILLDLTLNVAYRDAFGRIGQQRVREHFTNERIAAQMRTFLLQLPSGTR